MADGSGGLVSAATWAGDFTELAAAQPAPALRATPARTAASRRLRRTSAPAGEVRVLVEEPLLGVLAHLLRHLVQAGLGLARAVDHREVDLLLLEVGELGGIDVVATDGEA